MSETINTKEFVREKEAEAAGLRKQARAARKAGDGMKAATLLVRARYLERAAFLVAREIQRAEMLARWDEARR